MSRNGNVIYTPVDMIGDISATLAANNGDIGTLATYGSIQKWSLWKPYAFGGLDSPTNLEVAQHHFGINVDSARHTSLENAVKDSTNTQPDPQRVSAPSGAYAYTKPTTNFRMGDFADFDDATAPPGLQFARRYDSGACAPDSWGDWDLTEAQLLSLSNKRLSSIPGGTDWAIDTAAGLGIVYTNCNVKFGVSSNETVGFRPSNAMPLSLIFGNGTISGEKWRLGLAVYLPLGTAASNTARWMAFAGAKPLTAANGGTAFPHTASNIELCQALYYNFKTHGITSFTFIPCILCNCSLSGYASSSTQYVTRVALSLSGAKLLCAPTFTKCTLSISATPKPGKVESYQDSAYRGYYATNLVAGTYKVQVGIVETSGSGYTRHMKWYRVTLSSNNQIVITHSGSSSTGNLSVTASGNVTYYEYASESAYQNNIVSGGAISTSAANAASFFMSYVGASAPASVTPTLSVTKI